MRLLILAGTLILSGYVPEKPKQTIQIVCPTPETCYQLITYTGA